jgi:hypothetical protein
MQLSNFRPEFRSGLDGFTKFVLDRTRPKQLGASTMTGPILAGLTQSFLDAIIMVLSLQSLHHGRYIMIAYSNVASVFLAYSALNVFAVGAGSARSKFEKLLHSSLKKAFEVILSLLISCF